MGKKAFKFLKWILVIVVLALIAFSIYISDQVAQGVSQLSDPKETKENSMNFLKSVNFDYEQFAKDYPIEIKNLQSTYEDHQIPVAHIKTKKSSSQGAVIMIHGLGGTKESVLPICQYFLDLGYDVYSYDQRNCGDNTARTNSFGFFESKDLNDVVDEVAQGLNPEHKLVVWGESFGGATAGIGSKAIEDKVDYLILDSPMSDGQVMTKSEMASIEKETGLPASYMTLVGDWNLRLLSKYSLEDTKVVNYIKDVKTPLLVFHSKDDQVIPFSMGQEIYEASAASDKEFVTVDQGEHVMLFFENPDLYKQAIKDFLKP